MFKVIGLVLIICFAVCFFNFGYHFYLQEQQKAELQRDIEILRTQNTEESKNKIIEKQKEIEKINKDEDIKNIKFF